jgi:long-chain acyl-CoA synthetase
VDRKKDLLKLSFGEYISLGKVEAHLKSSPIVDNICVYGSGKKDFLIAFVVPNPVVLKEMAKKLGRAGTDVSDSTIFENLCLDEEINSAAFQQIKSYGVKSGLLRYEVPTKIKLCHEQWTPDSGLVTAALKIRRRPIQDFYQSDIDRMMS